MVDDKKKLTLTCCLQGIQCAADQDCKYTMVEHNECHCPTDPDIQCDCPEPWSSYEGTCVPKAPDCGNWVVCYMFCQHGNTVNKDGCPVCHCRPAPDVCENHNCEPGKKCVPQEVQCVTTPCYPQPTCVPDSGMSHFPLSRIVHCVIN